MVGCQTLPCTPIRALVLCWSATVTSSGPARRVGKIPLIFRLLCFSFFLPPSLFSACFCRRRLLFVVCGRSLSGFVVESFWLARPRLESNTELLLGVARAPTVRYRAVFGLTVFFFFFLRKGLPYNLATTSATPPPDDESFVGNFHATVNHRGCPLL